MAIVYYKNSKTGRTYAYESDACWSAEKGYSVPKRKYLGRVDPDTNEIIYSDGKRGRKPKDKSSSGADSNIIDKNTQNLQNEIAELKQKNRELQNQLAELRKQNNDLSNVIRKSITILSSAAQ